MVGFLASLSKHGTTVLATGVALGLIAPWLADVARPAMPFCVFVFVLGTLLRVDTAAFKANLRRPAVSVALPAAVMIAVPVTVGCGVHAAGIGPELSLALVLASSAPPSSGNAAVARMMGLDGTVPLVVTLLSMALAPLTVPLLAGFFGGASISPWDLAIRLAVLVGSAEGIAVLVRTRAAPYLAKHGPSIDGVIVVALLVFALATMAGVHERIAADPKVAAEYVAVAFAFNILLQIVGAALFPGSFYDRVAVGITVGNRNVGLVWAALGAAASPATALFFACTQFPIYTLPRLLHVLVRRRAARSTRPGARPLPSETRRGVAPPR